MIPQLTAAKFDPAQTKSIQELKHASPLIGCRIEPQGRFIIASAQDNTLERWELSTGKKTPLVGHMSWVRGIAFHPSAPWLLSADYAGRVLRWRYDSESPKPDRTIDAHKGWVRAVAVSVDGKLFATCGNDNLVRLWSFDDGKLVRSLDGHDCHVYNIAFHPNGKHLASADLKGNVKQWELADGKFTRDFDAKALHKYDTGFRADIGGIRGMAFNADGSLLACAGITEVSNAFAGVGKPLTVLFDWATGKQKQKLVPKENFQGTGWGVAFHPSGYVMGVGGGTGGALWFWKPNQAQAVHTVKLPNNARDLSLHPDGARFAIAFGDGAVRVYSASSRKPS